MRLEFNNLVASDISRIMDYYEDVVGAQLADEFYEESLQINQSPAAFVFLLR